jgi:anti-sigma factor RsiW
MNCHSFINVLDLHREGRLSPRLARAAARHLAACAACRALGAPDRSPAPSARAPQAFKAKLLAAAKAGAGASPETPAESSDLPLWPRETRGIALAAAALLIVGLFVAAAGVPSQSAGAVAAVEEP